MTCRCLSCTRLLRGAREQIHVQRRNTSFFFFFFSPFYLFLRQGAELGIKEKRCQLVIRSAAVVLSPSFSMPVDVVSFVLGVPS